MEDYIVINTNIDDILIEKVISLVESIDKYVSGLANQPASTVEWITLILAIIASIASIISIRMNYKSDKKNRESSEEIAEKMRIAEDERNKAIIDANLTANARIEWIQNVRQATAELITACYKYIGSKLNEQQEALEFAKEKKALFILYFGPDDDFSEEIIANNLFDKKTNKGKNNKLVSFVEELYPDMSKYHKNLSDIEYYKEKLRKCKKCLIYDEEKGEFMRTFDCPKDEYDTPLNEEDCTSHINELEENIRKHTEIKENTFEKLQKLSEIMRIYIKIEWNRAKKGK